MSNFIENSNRSPELVESSLKSLITPVANFVGVLTALPAVTVDLIGDDELVYGTFVLDTVQQQVKTGFITNLPARIRFAARSGSTGRFTITVTGSV